jgi:hypothetical protein
MNRPADIVITVFSDTVAGMEAAALDRMIAEQFNRAHITAVPRGETHDIVERKDLTEKSKAEESTD